MDKAKPEDLRKRVEEATGADRKLDGLLFKAMQPDEFARLCSFKGRRYAGHVHTPAEKREHEARMGASLAPAYTASLDAVLALVGERLPGWGIELFIGFDSGPCVAGLHGPNPAREFTGRGKTPALALLSALLDALSALEVSHG